jgi:hypothetical protein
VGSIPASRTKTEGPSVKLGPFSFKGLHSFNDEPKLHLKTQELQNAYKTPTKYHFNDPWKLPLWGCWYGFECALQLCLNISRILSIAISSEISIDKH